MPNTVLRITRRQGFLLLVGFIYTVVGAAYALPEDQVKTRPQDAYSAALALVPSIEFWGTLWCLAGAVAVATSLTQNKDHVGFVVLTSWSAAWGVLAWCSTLFFDSWRGWIAGLIWLAFGLGLLLVDGMDRPPKVP